MNVGSLYGLVHAETAKAMGRIVTATLDIEDRKGIYITMTSYCEKLESFFCILIFTESLFLLRVYF